MTGYAPWYLRAAHNIGRFMRYMGFLLIVVPDEPPPCPNRMRRRRWPTTTVRRVWR